MSEIVKNIKVRGLSLVVDREELSKAESGSWKEYSEKAARAEMDLEVYGKPVKVELTSDSLARILEAVDETMDGTTNEPD